MSKVDSEYSVGIVSNYPYSLFLILFVYLLNMYT